MFCFCFWTTPWRCSGFTFNPCHDRTRKNIWGCWGSNLGLPRQDKYLAYCIISLDPEVSILKLYIGDYSYHVWQLLTTIFSDCIELASWYFSTLTYWYDRFTLIGFWVLSQLNDLELQNKYSCVLLSIIMQIKLVKLKDLFICLVDLIILNHWNLIFLKINWHSFISLVLT